MTVIPVRLSTTLGWMLPLLLTLACAGAYDGPLPSGEGAAVYGKVLSILGAGIGDVEICAWDQDLDCVHSEGDGDFLLEPLPQDSDLVVTMTKDGHLPTAYHHHTSVDQEWRKTLMADAIVNSMTNRVDVEQEPGKGHLMFILWTGPDYDDYDRVEGMSFAVDPPGGASFYQAGGGLPDPDLSATSSSGSGGTFNLDPGDYTVSFSGAGRTCRPWFSFDFEPGEPVPVMVLPDRASYMDLVCT